MLHLGKSSRHQSAAGFTLPSILIVTGALLILAVGILLVTNIERSTARSVVDRQRAELAALAGLEEVKSIFSQETANDEFIILQSALEVPISEGRIPNAHLFLARGKTAGDAFTFRYVPLFSSLSLPATTPTLAAPKIEELIGINEKHWLDFTTLPYTDKVRAAWLPVTDENDLTVARYAYWVEDLQGRLDPEISGNLDGDGKSHLREPSPFLAPGLDDPTTGDSGQTSTNQVALYAIDPEANETDQKHLAKTLINNRKLIISPDSLLAAADIVPPLSRDNTGRLLDLKAREVEENLVSGIEAYDEQPIIPCVLGIHPSVSGKPKLNLNQIVTKGGKSAVEEMANFINAAYPTFEERKGGFPDNYVKTLAANAIDYADEDKRSTLSDDEYRGIDSYPLTTELALKVAYEGMNTDVNGHQIMNFNIKLFGEMYNPTQLPVSGPVRLSYEVAFKFDSIGTGIGSPAFDSSEFLDNSAHTTHKLEKIDGKYWSPEYDVKLSPNEYKCYLFAEVKYHLDQGTVASNPIGKSTPFSLKEENGECGCSMMWNDDIVERQQGIYRHQGLIFDKDEETKKKISGYYVGEPDTLTKSHYPGLLYFKPIGGNPDFYGNTGDPRISHYMNRAKNSPLAESAYPENASPNRRSVRQDVYKKDDPEKPKVYVRTLPSEWPDGGHNSLVGNWSRSGGDAIEMTDSRFNFLYDSDAKYSAIQLISNRGYFCSVTELGNLFDPIMYSPKFESESDTNVFLTKSKIPPGEVSWPDAKGGQGSTLYGGGNTLRIGRPEHPVFDSTGDIQNRAVGLLDLFHTGQPLTGDTAMRTSPLVKIHGNVNINTASRDVLRAMVAGTLVMDPKLSKLTSTIHDNTPTMAPPTIPLKLDAPKKEILADTIADAIIAARPFASPSRLALAKDKDGNEVFGSRKLYADQKKVQWTDAAAEEVFARAYQSATVRSRNFRVWVVAQSVAPAASPSSVTEIRAEVRKVYTIMADPGKRAADGSIISGTTHTKLLNTRDF